MIHLPSLRLMALGALALQGFAHAAAPTDAEIEASFYPYASSLPVYPGLAPAAC